MKLELDWTYNFPFSRLLREQEHSIEDKFLKKRRILLDHENKLFIVSKAEKKYVEI